ncbi:MAG: N-acetylmuramidase domain-containing protein [Rhodospirillales bacterium]
MTTQQCPCLQAMQMNREVDQEFDPELLEGEFEMSDSELEIEGEAGDFEFETDPEFEAADQELEAGDFELETDPEYEAADQEFEAWDGEFEAPEQEDAFETWQGEVAKRPRILKDNSSLQQVSMRPPRPVRAPAGTGEGHKRIAQTYNRIGGLLSTLASKLKVDPAAVLAVWMIESGGRRDARGRPIIRFENHVLYRLWGERNRAQYDRQFRHGSHAGVPGKRWQNHMFRASAAERFRPVHGAGTDTKTRQDTEYAALNVAAKAAGADVALRSASMGGAQILGANHALLGYASPREMYQAMKAGERADVLGFFDFCRNRKAPNMGDLMRYLRRRDWRSFARSYNGPGLVDHYAPRLAKAYEAARKVLAPAGAPQKEVFEYV